MENFPKPVNKQEQKEEIKIPKGINFVFEQYPEIKEIAQESLEPSFEDKKRIFEMLRLSLIESVRDTEDYEKYNGETLAVSNFSEDSYELLVQGLEENNINIRPRLNNLQKTFEEQNNQGVIPEDADVMDYFNPSTGAFSAFTSEQEKEISLKNTEHDIELLKYLENKDGRAKEIYGKYLETIFPESQVKGIVYHSSKNNDIQKFSTVSEWTGAGNEKFKIKQETSKGLYTTKSLDYIKEFQKNNIGNHIYSLMVSVDNPLVKEGVVNSNDIEVSKIEEFQKNGFDGIISDEGGKENTVIAFEPKQIHILGSQKDQEMFKEFLDKTEGKSSKLELPPVSIIENPTERQKKTKGSMSSTNFNIESGGEEIGAFILNVMGRPGKEGYGYFNTIKLEEEFRGKDYSKSVYLEVIKKLKEDNKKLSTEWTLTKGSDTVWQWLVENGYARVKQEGERKEENKGAGYSSYQYESI